MEITDFQQHQRKPQQPYSHIGFSPLSDQQHLGKLGINGVSTSYRHPNSAIFSNQGSCYPNALIGSLTYNQGSEKFIPAINGSLNDDSGSYSSNSTVNFNWISPINNGGVEILGQTGFASSSSASQFSGDSFMDLKSQAMDLSGVSRFGLNQFSGGYEVLADGELKEGGGLLWERCQTLESNGCSSNASTKASHLKNRLTTRAPKRPTGADLYPESLSKASRPTSSSKKPSPSNAPCHQVKVNKEILREKISSLHQLVSPFGKTDQASVLTETIRHIQVLQDQVHALYMRYNVVDETLRNARLISQTGLRIRDGESKEQTWMVGDLKRRGLCLVHSPWASTVVTADDDHLFQYSCFHSFA